MATAIGHNTLFGSICRLSQKLFDKPLLSMRAHDYINISDG